MKSLERIRLSVNPGKPGVRLEVWSETGKFLEGALDLDGEDIAMLAAQMVVMGGASGAIENLDVVTSILGRFVLVHDSIADCTPPTLAGVIGTPTPTVDERTCEACRLTFETFTAKHGHKCEPDKVIDCDVCGKPCANNTGLSSHRRSRHPDRSSIQKPARPQQEAHEPAPVVEPGPVEHRLGNVDRIGYRWRLRCVCGDEWIEDQQDDARAALRAHMDEQVPA